MNDRRPTLDEATSFLSLCKAAARAARRKRKTPEVCRFLMDLEPEVLKLQRELADRSYAPRPYRSFTIRYPKLRLISAAHFRDRVVHHALCAAIEPQLERYAIADSFACRRGKGMKRALRRAQQFARRWPYALRLDIRRFFPSIDHAVLEEKLHRRIEDPGLRWLIRRFLDAGAPGCEAGKGLPIGNLTSQHFGNFTLAHLDRHTKQTLRVKGYLRYMDDILVFGDRKPQLWEHYHSMQRFLADELKLVFREGATRLWPTHEGLPFLGFRIWPQLIRFGPNTARRWRRKMRALQRGVDSGRLAEEDASSVATSLLGWAAHGDTTQFRRSFFRGIPQSPPSHGDLHQGEG